MVVAIVILAKILALLDLKLDRCFWMNTAIPVIAIIRSNNFILQPEQPTNHRSPVR